jgi:hypothetical protein
MIYNGLHFRTARVQFLHFRTARVQFLHCRPTFCLVTEMGKHQENYLNSIENYLNSIENYL